MPRLRIASISIGVLSTVISLMLVYFQLSRPPFCPSLFGIPACFIVLGLYIGVVVTAFTPVSVRNNFIYFAITGSGLAIGIWFSALQIMGHGKCPVLFDIPLPLCFASLFAFAALSLMRWLEIKTK